MTRTGRCNCGAVHLAITGPIVEVGLCHCRTCQRETGATAMAFVAVATDDFAVTGSTVAWTKTTENRHFCPICGTALYATSDDPGRVEVRLGALDRPEGLTPTVETWTSERLSWLAPIPGATQHAFDAPD